MVQFLERIRYDSLSKIKLKIEMLT